MVESGPIPAIHGIVRWRLKDLAMWVWEEFRVSVSETTVSRSLRALGYRKLSEDDRDLEQAHLAIEALRALLPVLEGSVDEGIVRDFKQVTSNLQLAYADAAKGKSAES